MVKKMKIGGAIFISAIMVFNIGMTMKKFDTVYAEEMSTLDKNRMLGATTMDWQSTNLREWLNSDKMIVDYTAKKPTYDSESGFLSNQNFSVAEREGIAVTKHGLGYQYSLEGNTSNTMYYSQRSVSHNDYVFNDKVFILHYTDIMNYIEKNKLLLEQYKKSFSNTIQKQTNRKEKYDFLVNSGYYNTAYAGTSAMFTSDLRQVNGRQTQNIVPALSLKPTFEIGDGRTASELKIGEMVYFGSYNGERIEWEVINKTDNGYPLLWSTKILAMKEYDIDGDINPKTSNYINFPTSDVDISTGIGQAKSRETQKNIDSTTTVSFPNQSVLTTPTNDTSITLKIKASDTKYGIRSITLPNGVIIEGDYAEWTFHKNGEYDILVENNQGVLTPKHIVTKAINTPAEVNITTDKDMTSKWTNRPVNVSISASNNGVYNLLIKGNKEMKYSSASTGIFPAWMPLGGKRLHIKGTIRNAITDEQQSQVDMNAKVRLRGNYVWYSYDQVGLTFPIARDYSLKELKEKGEIVVDEIYVIPNNVYGNYYLNISMMDSNTAYMREPYNYWISDFTYELLDKDDLKIEEITFPDGSKSFTDKVTYKLSENGSYTFSVKDNRGKVTEKTIDVAIDMEKPIVKTIGIQPKIVKEQTIEIEATDGLSGVKRIKLPNGEYRNGSSEGEPLSIEYNIVENGEYLFAVEDYAGNITNHKVIITNVDNVKPDVQSNVLEKNWTKKSVTISIQASDSQGVIRKIYLPDGTVLIDNSNTLYRVSKNGEYSFIVEDVVGNRVVKTVMVSNIDTSKPTIQLTEKKDSQGVQLINIKIIDIGDVTE